MGSNNQGAGRGRYWALGFLALLGALYLGPRLIPLPHLLFEPDYSVAVLDRDGQLLRVFLNKKEQWHLEPQLGGQIPAKLKQAVVLFEDRRFYRHWGIDPLALGRALWQNLVQWRRVSGASTISMQVARLMQPKARSWAHKMLEMVQALGIESRYGKEEILALYLAHAPYGGNIVGYRAAARRFFGKWPQELSWAEAATLAVLPNAPSLASPLAGPKRLREKRDRLLDRLLRASAIDSVTWSLARREKVPQGEIPFALAAPHLARRVARLDPFTVRTTIDGALQRRASGLVKQWAARLARGGIANAAALVVETQSGAVRAYVGSQGFFAGTAAGQVDGVVARRSSGSLLKPFLYALAMDEGLVLPATWLQDVPTQYGSFAPRNADEGFDGFVRVEQALIRSLNVPAVRLLRTYGQYAFYQFLQAAGVSTLFRHADEYGLPLIIGGAEVTLWDMAALYRGLGRQGHFGPLHVIEGQGGEREVPLVSPGACYLTLEMLRQLQRPGAEDYWGQYENQWPLAWKTGTSYGQRDAWAIGLNPAWTVAVWAGNFSGEGNGGLAGSRSAGPLLFELFNMLPKEEGHSWFAAPEADLRQVALCEASGFSAGGHCPQGQTHSAPAQARPLAVCPYHQTLYVEGDVQVCSLCWEPGAYSAQTTLVYPAAVGQLLDQRGLLPKVLPHKATCKAQAADRPLEIVYPGPGARLKVPRDFGGQWQQVALRVAHRQPGQQLFWYLDDVFLGATRGRHVLGVDLAQGWHVLEVVDEGGYRDRRRFFVERLD